MYGLVPAAAQASAGPTAKVTKSPHRRCCAGWVEHMRVGGIGVTVHELPIPFAARAATGMPDGFGACHSASAGPCAIEGHEPAADVRKRLARRPAGVGIAVPAMPPGSPGMGGPRATAYDTPPVRNDRTGRVYAHH
ncbi:MAG: DUF411 domain-containing protein [Betaproteobacteria bacterium]|nr:DUF411 domain-containing protein [Betaproteobacteria bacterium]